MWSFRVNLLPQSWHWWALTPLWLAEVWRSKWYFLVKLMKQKLHTKSLPGDGTCTISCFTTGRAIIIFLLGCGGAIGRLCWLFRWAVSLSFLLKVDWQNWHLWARMLLWVASCLLRWSFLANALPHIWQLLSAGSDSVFMWLLRCSWRANWLTKARWQVGQSRNIMLNFRQSWFLQHTISIVYLIFTWI